MTDRPLDPRDLVAWFLHAEMHEGCHLPTCGCPDGFRSRDIAEAERLVGFLEDHGAFLSYGLSLPETAPSGKRETSRKAAASIADLKGGQAGVYALVACHGSHGLTDAEINAQYPQFAERNGFPRIAADSPRKRRESLSTAGHIVDSGRTRPTDTGHDAIVWQAVSVAAECRVDAA